MTTRIRVNFSSSVKGIISVDVTLEKQGDDLEWLPVLEEATALLDAALIVAAAKSKVE